MTLRSQIGSRRLLTYRRLKVEDIQEEQPVRQERMETGTTANELNSFRKRVSLVPILFFLLAADH